MSVVVPVGAVAMVVLVALVNSVAVIDDDSFGVPNVHPRTLSSAPERSGPVPQLVFKTSTAS